ncbi:MULTISPECIES: hypothetical protein [Micromonospora]|uniref:Uncharacterized protein n=1 Tax=Micromonospora rifamycinica TaxID=291594 RepID=A0A125Q1R6_9ACTN|nr:MULTISPECIES: hypothetical protein [Micromonospora]KWV33002.1 hypothetical protein AWV63_09230 [Micromonospora rifamycinica]WFE66242.1 hypothetical protein O7625_24410 [Micromonospora sp. WMMD714]SCG37530.1 hypothetical protein GA0070623_0324 [Micromonospora rifamycinica]
MTDQHAELDVALERVIDAARAHLTAVRAAQGRIDDDDVWQAYVALNNASFAYDEQLLDAFGEVTPWDVESIDPDEADERFGSGEGDPATDPHPQVISVRQRRDYRVPSVSALLRVAEVARREGTPEGDEPAPVEGVGEAVLELLQGGDGSLGALDVPELEPLDGVVMVSEVGTPVDLESFSDDDPVGPFTPAADDRLVGRLDEHPFLDEDDHDHAGHQH